MILFFSVWLLLVLVLSFWNLKWGVALFLMYMVLVPYIKLKFGGIELGQNLFNFAFLASYFYYAKTKMVQTDWKPLTPFVFYFVATLIAILFQNNVPFSIMLNNWRVDVMGGLILPFVIWNVARNEPDSITIFRNSILLSIIISVVYGLFLITTEGLNPYIMYLMNFMDVTQDMEKYYEAAGEGRLFGRISSVFIHPMGYAFFLGMSFIYTFQCRNHINKIFVTILLLLIGISIITCGVRSVIGALLLTVAYFFFLSKNYKIMLCVIVLLIFVYIIAECIPELSKYLGSIMDVKNEKGDVSGSSIDLRIFQLEGAIKEGSKNPLFGLGYGWTNYYQSLKGNHPTCLAFESLIYVIICNSGLFGFVIWTYMIVKFIKINHNMHLNDIVIFDCLMVFYISYSCITGENGYMKTFLIFYILLLCNDLQEKIEFSN